MFFRIILFLVLVAVVSLGINWVTVNEGTVQFVWLGYKVATSMTFFIFAFALVLILLIIIFQILITIIAIPKKIGKRYSNYQLEQNLNNLQIGYAALLSGDFVQAKKYSQRLSSQASKNRSVGNLADMLAAKVAQEEGHTEIAQDYYDKFLGNKKHRFFAVKSMLDSAFAQGNIEDAMSHAEEAYRLKPNVKDGARSLLELYKKAGKYDKAEDFLNRYKRKHFFTKDRYNNIDVNKELGAIWFAHAKEIFENDKPIRIKDKSNLNEARRYAEMALKTDPYNKEIIMLLLKIYKLLKLEGKARSLMEKLWYKVQSFELGMIYLDSFTAANHKDAVKKKLRALEGLKNGSSNPQILEKLKDSIYDVHIEN